MTTTTVHHYDSREATSSLRHVATEIWDYRGLLRLLVIKQLTVQYKRSFLGAWWTLLMPVLTTAILWVVFGQLFRFGTPGLPYIVYLLGGMLVVTFFSEGLVGAASSLVDNEGIVTKIRVPPELFTIATACAATINLLFGVIPLLLVQVVTGAGIPWTVVFVPILGLAMLPLLSGIGLILAAGAVQFYDLLDFTRVGVRLLAYLTPSFYPIDIVPDSLRFVVYANPATAYLEVFRSLASYGRMPPLWSVAIVAVTSAGSLLIGAVFFRRRWPRLVAML